MSLVFEQVNIFYSLQLTSEKYFLYKKKYTLIIIRGTRGKGVDPPLYFGVKTKNFVGLFCLGPTFCSEEPY